MSEKQAALDKARQRYQIDYQGIFLNTVVSVLSSASATAVTSFLTQVPASKLPAVATGIFVAQVLPKLFIEVHKSYFRNKARREAFSEGLLSDEELETGKSKNYFLSACESASYY